MPKPYNVDVEKDHGRKQVSPTTSHGKPPFSPHPVKPTASNRRSSVGGLTWRGLDPLVRLSGSCAPTQRSATMPTIKANTQIVTQVNVFTVPDGGQQALIDFLIEAATFASTTPGWISASIHRSVDGTRVVNYAQSESPEAAQRIIERLRKEGWLDRNKSLGKAEPGLYEVVFTLDR
jgi:hypothetical protein